MWDTLRQDKHIIPGLMTGAFGAWLCWHGLHMPHASGWSSSPGLFPAIIGVGLMLLAGALFLEGRRLSLRSRAAAAAEPQGASAGAADGAAPDGGRRTAAVTAVIAGYVVALTFVQFEIATTFFIVGAMWVFGERSPVRMVVLGVLTSITVSLAFIFGLQTLLPGTGSVLEPLLR